MKKFLLASASAAAILATTAFAQGNDSEVIQAGNSNSATVGQAGDGNVSGLSQLGDNSQATLDQSGDANVSEIMQQSLNKANVAQLGTDGESHVIQNGNQNDAINHNGGIADPGGIEEPIAYGVGVRQRATSVEAYSYIEQNGTGAWAEVDQDGANNSSDIRQGNNLKRSGDRAFVDQRGDDNVSTVKQSVDDTGPDSNPAYGGANTVNYSIVNQSGSRNTSNITQNAVNGENDESPNALATVNQLSDDNKSDITQNSDAVASVTQSGGDYNVSSIEQQLNSDGAYATVVQTGALNASQVIQSADATATVNQTGGYNHSFVTQNAAATANVTQGGIDNKAVIEQFAGADNAGATIIQDEEGATVPGYPSNDARITQSADATGTITQTGDNNVSTIEQLASSGNSEATSTQNGAGNRSDIKQIGSTTFAFVEQIGASNVSTITQDTANQHDANVRQEGAGNYSSIYQRGTLGNAGDESNVGVNQTGDRNSSTIEQSGVTYVSASVTQTGDDNFSTLDQNGKFLEADLTQVGNGNYSDIIQRGEHNSATVNQYGNDNVSHVDQSGSGNTATVIQGAALVN
jgi:hypothetical protein